jgi:hypothetical protein
VVRDCRQNTGVRRIMEYCKFTFVYSNASSNRMERRIPGFMPAKMPYHRSSLIKDVALSTAPK